MILCQTLHSASAPCMGHRLGVIKGQLCVRYGAVELYLVFISVFTPFTSHGLCHNPEEHAVHLPKVPEAACGQADVTVTEKQKRSAYSNRRDKHRNPSTFQLCLLVRFMGKERNDNVLCRKPGEQLRSSAKPQESGGKDEGPKPRGKWPVWSGPAGRPPPTILRHRCVLGGRSWPLHLYLPTAAKSGCLEANKNGQCAAKDDKSCAGIAGSGGEVLFTGPPPMD